MMWETGRRASHSSGNGGGGGGGDGDDDNLDLEGTWEQAFALLNVLD